MTTAQLRDSELTFGSNPQVDFSKSNFRFIPGVFDVPVCAITNLKSDKIYASNHPPGYLEEGTWSLTGAKVVITRFWSSSTAYFTMTFPLLESRGYPPTLPEDLRFEQEVCIYMGYLDQPRPVRLSDLSHTKYKDTPDRLKRVYVGVIEIISTTFTGTGGYTATFQCRDRMKWLMDTTTTFNPLADKGEIEREVADKVGGPNRSSLILEVAKRGIGQTIDDENSCGCGRNIVKSEKYRYDADDTITNDAEVIDPNGWYKDEGPLQNILEPDESREPTEDPEFRIYTSRSTLDVDQKQDFLIANQIPAEMIKYLSLQEVYPTEVFQHHSDGHFYYVPRMNASHTLTSKELSYRTYFCKFKPVPGDPEDEQTESTDAESTDTETETESTDTEASSDEVTTTGTNDNEDPGRKERDEGYETLRVDSSKHFDESLKISDANQMLLRFKEEQTSIGLKTNILVRSSSSNVRGSLGESNIHLRTRPYILKRKDADGNFPKFACKFAIYQDSTIGNTTEAAVIAINMARILGKETRAATGVVLGDPTLSPGEVCQVVNSPFQYQALSESQTVGLMKADRAKYFSFENNSINSSIEYIQALRRAEGENPDIELDDIKLFDGTIADIKSGSGASNGQALLCEDPSVISSPDNEGPNEGLKDLIGYNEEPRSMWRIEALIHNFNMGSKGYTTEVAWTSPF